MTVDQSLQKKFDFIIKKRSQLINDSSAHPYVDELDFQIEKLRVLFDNKNSIKEKGGCAGHPLGSAPHLNSVILFHLECCYAILKIIDNPSSLRRFSSIDPDKLIYPTMMATVWRRLLSLLLQIRINHSTLSKQYDHPKISEVIYFRMPHWFEVIFHKLRRIKVMQKHL